MFQGWVVASSTVADPNYVIRNLRSGTSYMFLVRSQNSHGLSLPSPVTTVVKTRGIHGNSIVHGGIVILIVHVIDT